MKKRVIKKQSQKCKETQKLKLITKYLSEMTREKLIYTSFLFLLFYVYWWRGEDPCIYALYTLCVPSALRGQEKVSDPLELELEVVVSCQLGGGIRTQILQRVASTLL